MTVTGTPAALVDNPLQRRVCELRLQGLLRKSEALQFACLGTVDGRPWAFQRRGEGSEPQRLAAITSSLLALCETFARESLKSRCLYNVMNAEHGVVVTVRVPCKSGRFALSLGASEAETIALTLRYALDAANELASVLDTELSPPPARPVGA